MSSWLNRTSTAFVQRASPSDMAARYPADVPFIDGNGNAVSNVAWIWNPDLTAVAGFASKYWVISGDLVSLMDQAARDAVDAQEAADALTADRDANKTRFDGEKVLTALSLVIMDEINILRSQHGLADRTAAQLRTAVFGKVDSLG